MYPLGRPQTRQRLTTRVLYFGVRCDFTIIDFLAIATVASYFRNGMPSFASNRFASWSVFAVVQIATFSPLIRSMLS